MTSGEDRAKQGSKCNNPHCEGGQIVTFVGDGTPDTMRYEDCPDCGDRAKQGEAPPCPLCGGPAKAWAFQDGGGDVLVECRACQLTLSACTSEAEAIAAWNRRESRAATRAGEADLRRAIEEGVMGVLVAHLTVDEATDRILALMKPPAAGDDAEAVERVADELGLWFMADRPRCREAARAAMKALAGGGGSHV